MTTTSPAGPIVAEGVSQSAVGAAIVVTAWGETKNLHEWTRDPRCKAPYGTVKSRLGRLKPWTTEDALSTPPADTQFRRFNKDRAPKYEAFGERKTINEWLADPRCEASAHPLRKRIARGVPMETALRKATPADWRKGGRVFEIYGERKLVSEWAADPRCKVGPANLRKLLASGANPQDALEGKASRKGAHRAFGETKTLQAWARDPRCVVSRQALRLRLTAGMALESALTAPKGAVIVAANEAAG